MKSILLVLISTLVFSFASKATIVTVTSGSASFVPGIATTNLDNGLPSNFSLFGLNSGIQLKSVIDVSLEPSGNNSPYLYVGPGSMVAATFFGGISYIGFDWGSPDMYNTLTLVDADGSSTIYGEGGVSIPGLMIDQVSAQYVNFFANGPSIIYATWASTEPAFEINSIATLAVDSHLPTQNPTPEPPSIAMLIVGLVATFIGAMRGDALCRRVKALQRKGVITLTGLISPCRFSRVNKALRICSLVAVLNLLRRR